MIRFNSLLLQKAPGGWIQRTFCTNTLLQQNSLKASVVLKRPIVGTLRLESRYGSTFLSSWKHSATALQSKRGFATDTPAPHNDKGAVPTEHAAHEPTNLYGITASHDAEDHHGDPRQHLNPDGTTHFGYSSEHFHWYDPHAGTPPQLTTTVNGVKMLKGVESRPLDELYTVSQENLPFWPRTRINFWGNHQLGLKVEFLFFWIPTFIIASLAIPCLTMIYMSDESIAAAMTIKVIGRQWYWVYEVESPAEAEDEE